MFVLNRIVGERTIGHISAINSGARRSIDAIACNIGVIGVNKRYAIKIHIFNGVAIRACAANDDVIAVGDVNAQAFGGG